MDKSEFLKLDINFLGHVICKDTIKPNSNEIAAIEKYSLPKTTTEMQTFSRFIY